MEYSNTGIGEFISQLSSQAPVPGGGGASALVGAVGSALGCMVGALTVGKKKYAAVEEDLLALMEKSRALNARLLALIEEDARVFEPLSKAYSLPSSTEEEKAQKQAVMSEVLKSASLVPLEIMQCAAEGIDLLAEYGEKGTRIAISDVGVGAAFCASALKGASLNVFINTKAMSDRGVAEELNKRANDLLDKYLPIADNIFASVQNKLL